LRAAQSLAEISTSYQGGSLNLKTIGILIYPDVEEMDFVGPFEVLSYINKIQPKNTKVLLISETTEPVSGFNGMVVIPHTTLENCPPLDVFIAPGGKGRAVAMKNRTLQEFILKQMNEAEFVTSVCTGAFLLAEAGLLRDRKATTYHTAFKELEAYSVKVLPKKIVHDGKIITAAGVTSGIELGFYLLKLLFGEELSQEVARRIEYNVNINDILIC
jgi:cyclohexyl-isocyanide hydratase